ncbi:S53 family peptidase [Kordia algicida OT-1]|uniref:Kumamolisin n=1 Tax=Kordia algicida OT-1 TaxID=391587 RepID=A9DKC1_9FLAO|nr:S53 family peptidase [Kordia algicida]EDP98296.1 kumamolisin [Kordia algicida OT-1]
MEATQENSSQKDVLEIKVYVPINEVTERQQDMIDDAIKKHPRDRKYLSNTTHAEIFAPSKHDANDIIEHAEANHWEVNFDEKAREITIKINSEDIANEENPVTIEALKFLSTQGDLHLDVKDDEAKDKATAEDITDPTQKTGFVKSNKETRVGRGHAIPIQESIHGYSVLEIAEAYNFPDGDGEGQTIGIIELGGKFEQSDLDTFFAKYNMAVPEIQVIGKPATTPVNDNVEVTADIQVAGILAPKAKLVVYYGTSILNAMKMALADTENKLTVISISWAGSELGYSQQEIVELNNVFHEASLKGITVVGASGDNGALNNKQYANVNVPVNSPYVLACGGTQLTIFDNDTTVEVVWNESTPQSQIGSGGGFSQRIAEQQYQIKASQQYIERFPQFEPYHKAGGRGIPDIAANAADASGYSIYFEGNWVKIGGTSLATPLWAALIARMNQNLGYRLGFINPYLYQLENSAAFHQILEGNNNLYVAASGWNPCTGLGTPNGKELMQAIDNIE